MSTVIQSLAVALTLQTKAFDRGMANVMSGLKGLGSAIAGVIGVGGLVSMARQAIELGGNLTDMAARTGISSDKLDKLQQVAAEAGIEFEPLVKIIEKLKLGLERSTPAFDDAIKKLSLTKEQLKGLTDEERLVTIAKQLAEIEDPAKKFAVAVGLVGERLAGPLLQAMEMIGKDETGFLEALKRASALTVDQNKQLDSLGESWDRVWNAALRLVGAVTAEISGPLIKAMDAASEAIKNMKENVDQTAGGALSGALAGATVGGKFGWLGGIAGGIAGGVGGAFLGGGGEGADSAGSIAYRLNQAWIGFKKDLAGTYDALIRGDFAGMFDMQGGGAANWAEALRGVPDIGGARSAFTGDTEWQQQMASQGAITNETLRDIKDGIYRLEPGAVLQ